MTALGFRTEEEHPTSLAHLATVIYVTKRAVCSSRPLNVTKRAVYPSRPLYVMKLAVYPPSRPLNMTQLVVYPSAKAFKRDKACGLSISKVL